MALSLLEVMAGVLVGIFSAVFGVGGGIVLVPFMVLVLGFGQHAAEGTSLVVIIPTAVAGAAAHMRNRYVSLSHAGWLGAGGIAGAFAGATLALRMDAAALESLFGVLVVVVGVRLTVAGVRERRAG